MKEVPLPSGPLLISACLLGQACRYDGGHCYQQELADQLKDRFVIPICPEQLGGLGAPRPPAEIAGGDGRMVLEGKARVIDSEGIDRTKAFLLGAGKVAALAVECGAQAAILKERSPSCGVHLIHDGSFSGRKIPGLGVAAALLRGNGLQVWSEEDVLGID